MLVPLLCGGGLTKTASTNELKNLCNTYQNYFPTWTFPFIPLSIAAFFQSLAWLSGPNLFATTSLIPRLGIMWLLAGGEYLFMMPTMNAGIEIFGMSEPVLVVIYQVITIMIFILVNLFIFKKKLTLKHVIAFIFLILAVMIVYL
jgi:uncharacterized protein (DUF486 family)